MNSNLKNTPLNFRGVGVCLISIIFLFGCSKKPATTEPKYGIASVDTVILNYHFAIHPLYNPAKLFQLYQPLMDYLNQNVAGVHFTLEASRDYGVFEQKYMQREPDFILPNPWQTLQAEKVGYSVIAMAGDPKDFKGIFIVRKDGDIHQPSDLKGKAVSYPSPTALAACIMPQFFLHNHGVDVNSDIENIYVGSQTSSIMNVYLKKTSAGATWPSPWRDFLKDFPKEAEQLYVIWETESLVNNSVMVRNDIPMNIKDKVQKCLLELHQSEAGKVILNNMQTTHFLPATDKDYNLVQLYINRFEKEIRKVETK